MSDTDQMNDQEQGNVQADNNSMAVGRDVVIRDVQNSSIHIGNITNIIGESKPNLSEYCKSLDFEPETIYIAEGPFLMGSLPGKALSTNEYQQHEVNLPAYRIGKYPVTNSEYGAFIAVNSTVKVRPEMGWMGRNVPPGYENHPVVGVTFYEALAYCRWLTEITECRFEYFLPNEAQWEKAAKGGDNYLYPWGDEPDRTRSNFGGGQLAAVDEYPAQNNFGIHDLVGNVRQWTVSLWGEKYPVPDERYFRQPWKNDGRNNPKANGQIRRVVKGSSFQESEQFLRCSARSREFPDVAGSLNIRHGFRVVMND